MTRLADDLQLRGHDTIELDHVPEGLVLDLPAADGATEAAALLTFLSNGNEVLDRVPLLAAAADREIGAWLAYPRAAGSTEIDLTGEVLRKLLAAADLVIEAEVDLDDDWAALRVARRRP